MSEGFQFEKQGGECRYRKVQISGELILDFAAQGALIAARCTEGLPRDATITGYGHNGIAFVIVFHSPQWDVIPDGQEIPDQPMRYDRIEVP
jgi:hypothetical protein